MHRMDAKHMGEPDMKVKVKIAADKSTAKALRQFATRLAQEEVAKTAEEVALIAWMYEVARGIDTASVANLRLVDTSDRGHEMVLAR